jgi:pimeloyl-ACP methyl ester carboxylesterase
MRGRPLLAVSVGVVLAAGSCSGGAQTPGPSPRPPGATASRRIGRADVGGYSLAYECAGTGSPTVMLEAGYTASGIDTYGPTILPALARTTRVCTYDRAGDGMSDPRPASVGTVTGLTQAEELHALLAAVHVGGPYVLVGHSYGGMISREFAARYASEVKGMVLIDASSEPEIPVYRRLHAGAWLDGTVMPVPNRKIDILATVRQLERAPSLGSLPLVVITAGILQDRWLRTVPLLEARAQTRLANLSSDSIHILDANVGHFIPQDDPRLVISTVLAVLAAARSGGALAPCGRVVAGSSSARCIPRGQLAHQRV